MPPVLHAAGLPSEARLLPKLSISSWFSHAGSRRRLWLYGTAVCPSACWKLLYHTAISAISTGMLRRGGVWKKCLSIACAPANNSRKRAPPTATITGKPTGDQTE